MRQALTDPGFWIFGVGGLIGMLVTLAYTAEAFAHLDAALHVCGG